MAKKTKLRYDRRSLILQLLREFPNNKFSIKHLASASGGNTREGRRETMALLDELEREGVVALVGRDKYRLGSRMRPRYEGLAERTASGGLYIRVEGLENDIFVHQGNSLNALDGDRVEVAIMHTSKSGEHEGEILSILERSNRNYVGVAEIDRTAIFVCCISRRNPIDIFLPRKAYPEVEAGDKLVVRIKDWPEGSKSPIGELIENLGPAGDNDTEMHAILAEYDLPYRFEKEVERAAEAISGEITPADVAERRDFRGITTFTIDPADAKDFDDALSVRQLSDGVWEVGVHIADVSHYVTPDSLIDREAQERGTSVYLVDRTIPMLPERLCNELCSLRPEEEKCCFSAVFTLNEEAEVIDQWLGRTLICSNHRFAYEEAQALIEGGDGPYAEEILVLHRLAQQLRRERFRHGAVAFNREEMKFRLDEKGRPLGVYAKVQKEANQLIEEFMLLANRRVAEFCAHTLKNGRKVPRTMVYRVHDDPSPEKLDRFRSFILRFGHYFKAQKGRAVAKEMNKLLKGLEGRPEENTVQMLAVRSMAKAEYSTENIGHYGLAFPYYTHFTSPIRRYPDVMVHRLLAHYLSGGRSVEKQLLEERCEHANEREVIASEAERASIKYKAAEYLSDKKDQLFEGRISRLNEWGIFVELEETHIEGLLHLRELQDDFYRFDEEQYEICGLRSGKRYTLGDRLTVRVKQTDLRRRIVDFELA